MVMRGLRRFAEINGRERRLLIEAVCWLALARLALILIPFPRLARRLGRFVPPDEARRVSAAIPRSDADAGLALEVSRAVARAAGHAPFEAVCLPRALAARMMLERRGVASVIHFGAAKLSEKPFDAHAWLDAAGVEVTGYPVAVFSEIGCFV